MVVILILFILSFSLGAGMYLYFVVQDIRGIADIKENAWHVRLLEHIWNVKFTEFTGICNYAWAIFGTLTALPLIAIVALVISLIKATSKTWRNSKEAYSDYCDNKKQQFRESITVQLEEALTGPSDKPTSALISRWILKLINFNSALGKKQAKQVLFTIENSLSREAHVEIAKRVRLWEIEEKKRLAKKKAKKESSSFSTTNINHLATKAKQVFKVGGILTIIWIGTLLYRLWVYVLEYLDKVDWAYTFQVWKSWGIAAMIVISAVIILLICGVILVQIWKYTVCRLFNYCISCENRKANIKNFFKSILNGVLFPFKTIGKGFVFVIKLIIAYKDNNCTAINWVKEYEK